MESPSRVLLLVVLLGIVVKAEDGVCGGRSTAAVCMVAWVDGHEAAIRCSVEGNNSNNSSRASIDKSLNSSNIINISESGGLNPLKKYFNSTFQDKREDSLEENNFTLTHIKPPFIPKTELQRDKVLSHKTNILPNVILNNSRVYSSKHWSKVTNITVNLTGSIEVLDLLPFKNANSLIINSSIYSLKKICGSSNVSSLSIITSHKQGELPSINLLGLKMLNILFSNISLRDLKIPIESLDLSRSNVTFNGTINNPTTLKILNMSYNHLYFSDKNKKGFKMTGNLSVLIIKGNNLENVPDIDMVSLEVLNLSENNISTIKELAFEKLPSLTNLDLRKNHINGLKGRVFEGLDKLEALDLSENNIVSIAPSTFQFLNDLISLKLSSNVELGSVKNVQFASILLGTSIRLQLIDASRTQLNRIPLTITRSVRKLYLAGNEIENVESGELDSFPLLQILDISSNKITLVEEDALGRLDFLTRLILFNNMLTFIPKSLPMELAELDLRCNFVKILNQSDFYGLQKLRILLLSRNNIEIVEDGTFGELRSLEVLDLSHNPIKLLSRSTFIGPRNLKEMYLISLKNLTSLKEPLSFPAPESTYLEVLNLESSPVLASQLMEDTAALIMFHELYELNLNNCNLSTLRSDLPKYLPRINKLELSGNNLNCTNIIWLVKWLHESNISLPEPGRLRKEMYDLKDICSKKTDVSISYNEVKVVCSIPEYMSGKEIISLVDQDLPNLKLKSSRLGATTNKSIDDYYHQETVGHSSQKSHIVAEMIDTLPTQTLPLHNSNKKTSDKLIPNIVTTGSNVDINSTEDIERSHESKSSNILVNSKKAQTLVNAPITLKRVKTKNGKNSERIFTKNNTKYEYPHHDINHNSIDVDNHLNHSGRQGALKINDHDPKSHPGMVVFLLAVLGLVVVAALLYTQTYWVRRYQHQRDIEVSDLGGVDLW